MLFGSGLNHFAMVGWFLVGTPRRLQAGHPSPLKHRVVKWICKPKFHYFCHQLLGIKRFKENVRHTHCFTDEDAMRWLKNISRKVSNRSQFERTLMKVSRLRLALTRRKAKIQNRTASRRSRRWLVMISLGFDQKRWECGVRVLFLYIFC